MNNVAVRLRGLSKTYHLYEKQSHRFLDMYGLLKRDRYREHVALNDLSLDIRRGEKVAIIGRNGAGKSTILKLISDVIEATQGSIEINGKVHALLSVGTGFHPEFTGRENVVSYLAQLGVTGPLADHHIAEIIAFAELDEYIDQPLKTYSSGMGVRLMFAASTAITPDILVIDEVLAVGDAYFMQKCLRRMKDMCDQHGTTLILVTHDLYSAQMFCDRFIWLEEGQIALDGDGNTVIDAYEASVRDQEEKRLRNLRLSALRKNTEARENSEVLLCGRIRSASGGNVGPGIFVSHLSFASQGQVLAELRTTTDGRPDAVFPVLDEREGNWGPVESHAGRIARPFRTHGSIFKSLPFLIAEAGIRDAMIQGDLTLELGVFCAQETVLEIDLFTPDQKLTRTVVFPVQPGEWRDLGVHVADGAAPQAEAGPAAATPGIRRYGRHAMEITDVRFLDGDGHETMQFASGETLRIQLSYKINDPDFDECPAIVVAFMKDGLVRSHRFWTDKLRFRAAEQAQGTLEMVANELLLGSGSYLLNVAIFQEGFLTAPGPKPFFTANPKVYDMHSRAYEITVRPGNKFALMDDVIFHHKCQWILDGENAVEA